MEVREGGVGLLGGVHLLAGGGVLDDVESWLLPPPPPVAAAATQGRLGAMASGRRRRLSAEKVGRAGLPCTAPPGREGGDGGDGGPPSPMMGSVTSSSAPLPGYLATHDARGVGVYVHRTGRAVLTGCRIEQQRSYGVKLRCEGSVEMQRCTIVGNKAGAIAVDAHHPLAAPITEWIAVHAHRASSSAAAPPRETVESSATVTARPPRNGQQEQAGGGTASGAGGDLLRSWGRASVQVPARTVWSALLAELDGGRPTTPGDHKPNGVWASLAMEQCVLEGHHRAAAAAAAINRCGGSRRAQARPYSCEQHATAPEPEPAPAPASGRGRPMPSLEWRGDAGVLVVDGSVLRSPSTSHGGQAHVDTVVCKRGELRVLVAQHDGPPKAELNHLFGVVLALGEEADVGAHSPVAVLMPWRSSQVIVVRTSTGVSKVVISPCAADEASRTTTADTQQQAAQQEPVRLSLTGCQVLPCEHAGTLGFMIQECELLGRQIWCCVAAGTSSRGGGTDGGQEEAVAADVAAERQMWMDACTCRAGE